MGNAGEKVPKKPNKIKNCFFIVKVSQMIVVATECQPRTWSLRDVLTLMQKRRHKNTLLEHKDEIEMVSNGKELYPRGG